jgi:hypothetical protein
LKRVSEGKKNFVIPKLRNAVASNSYMEWGIWTPIFHNTWCIWTGITNICREFDLTKTSKSKFPGVCSAGGMSRFRFDSCIIFIYRESLKAHAIKTLDFYILKLKRSHCARTDYILCKASKLQHIL